MIPHYGTRKQNQRERVWKYLSPLFRPKNYKSVLNLVGTESQEIKLLRHIGFAQRDLVCVDKIKTYIEKAKPSAPHAFWWPEEVIKLPPEIIKNIQLAHLDFCSNICESVLSTIQYLTRYGFNRGGALAINIMAARDHYTSDDATRRYVIERAIRRPCKEIVWDKYKSDSGPSFLWAIYELAP